MIGQQMHLLRFAVGKFHLTMWIYIFCIASNKANNNMYQHKQTCEKLFTHASQICCIPSVFSWRRCLSCANVAIQKHEQMLIREHYMRISIFILCIPRILRHMQRIVARLNYQFQRNVSRCVYCTWMFHASNSLLTICASNSLSNEYIYRISVIFYIISSMEEFFNLLVQAGMQNGRRDRIEECLQKLARK